MLIPRIDFAARKVAPHRRADQRKTVELGELLKPGSRRRGALIRAGTIAPDDDPFDRLHPWRHPQERAADVRIVLIELRARTERCEATYKREQAGSDHKFSGHESFSVTVAREYRKFIIRSKSTTFSREVTLKPTE